MKKIEFTEEQIAKAFTEWERRYREDPETFQSEAEKLLRETPETYGEACAPYFLFILEKMNGRKIHTGYTSMSVNKTQAKEVIQKTVDQCFSTWILSDSDMYEILISICGDIAVKKDKKNG